MSRKLGKDIILETRNVAKADGVDVTEDECLDMFNRIVDSRQTNKSSMAFDSFKKKLISNNEYFLFIIYSQIVINLIN